MIPQQCKRLAEVARELVRAAHSDEASLVVDPFAAGRSIPLDALRCSTARAPPTRPACWRRRR